jgi:pyruvate kinase
MGKKAEKIAAMIAQIEGLIDAVRAAEAAAAKELEHIHPEFLPSARNLIHYRELRRHDLRDLQKQLGYLGLSRLAKAESHVMASLKTNRSILRSFQEARKVKVKRANFSIKAGKKMLNRNAKSLLGFRSKGRRTRIMVTLPSEAAYDFQLVSDMVKAGLNCARINCAHDNEEVWLKMIENVRKASRRHERNIKVCMDLGGPKIRTGELKPGPRVVIVQPKRDLLGRVVYPARIWLSPSALGADGAVHIPITEEAVAQLKVGDRLQLRDTRDKLRRIKIVDKGAEGVWGELSVTAYFQTGTLLRKGETEDAPTFMVGELPPVEQNLLLFPGDFLILHADKREGENARYDENGKILAPAHVSCSLPEIIPRVKAGERVLFDDGKIGGIVREAKAEQLTVEILRTKPNGGKLKADKGINFPNSDLGISGLTEKDRRDLRFVVQHADCVNFSFVNRPEDVKELLSAIEALGAKDKLGIILKIETQSGFNQLTHILLAAMQAYPIGVMIARGDLAIEAGWSNIGRIQEEIMSFCQAAHVSDIWATQVLETLAKKGLPSRAEITDAVMAQRADCVMLNKGPHILTAIGLLDRILKEMFEHQEKNAPLSPVLKKFEE